METMNPQIFREYDIRGVVEHDLDEEVLYRLGKAFASYLHRQGRSRVSLGWDCRPSSPPFAEAFGHGLLTSGIDVLELGMVTTPMMYFSLFTTDVHGGAMITASHNPSEYNGVKLCSGTDSLWGAEIEKLREIAEAGDFVRGHGTRRRGEITDHYVSTLVQNVAVEPGHRVALDCGNGTAGIVAPTVLTEVGCRLTELYTEPDGTFPNHHPDPGKEENLVDLIEAVRTEACEAGLAFDGDADRLGVVDEKGNVIWGDMVLLILARQVLREVPGATIIGDVKCSSRLYKAIEQAGGKPIMWKTGHSLIKHKLKETGAELAGEMSGHIFFKHRFYGYDDALYAGLRLLEELSHQARPLSALLDDVPPAYSTPEIRVECPEEKKFLIARRVTEKLKERYTVNDIDGARVELPHAWGLVRASNTQPVLVLRFEAETEEGLEEIRSIIENAIKEAEAEIG